VRRDQAGRPPGTREAPWSCPVCVPRSPAAPEWSTPPPDARGASPLLPSSAAAAREPVAGSAVRALPTTAHAAPGVVVALRRLGGLPHVSGAAGVITLPWLRHGRTTAPVQPGATLDGMAQQGHVPLPSAARPGEGTEGRRRRISGPAIAHCEPHAVLIPLCWPLASSVGQRAQHDSEAGRAPSTTMILSSRRSARAMSADHLTLLLITTLSALSVLRRSSRPGQRGHALDTVSAWMSHACRIRFRNGS